MTTHHLFVNLGFRKLCDYDYIKAQLEANVLLSQKLQQNIQHVTLHINILQLL